MNNYELRTKDELWFWLLALDGLPVYLQYYRLPSHKRAKVTWTAVYKNTDITHAIVDDFLWQ